MLISGYESIVLFLSVLIVNQTLSDGRSNWMEGLVLMFLYLIIAVSFWFYPVSWLFASDKSRTSRAAGPFGFSLDN